MKRKLAFALIMGSITTGIISYILLRVNTDYSGVRFFSIWSRSWIISYVIVIPCILLISPAIQKLVDKLIKA